MTNEMTSAERAFEFVDTALSEGRAVHISTYTTTTRITPKTVKAWEKEGKKFYALGKDGVFRIRRGRGWDALATPTTILVKITAEK